MDVPCLLVVGNEPDLEDRFDWDGINKPSATEDDSDLLVHCVGAH